MKPVYFVQLGDNSGVGEQVGALNKLVTSSKMNTLIESGDFVAIKLHVGEVNNTTHVKPELIKALVDICRKKSENVFLTETATLYKGQRDNAVKHIMHAERHGFGIEKVGAPFIMSDGLIGASEVEVEINGESGKTVKVAREIANTDVLIVVSHPTGHLGTGLGACLKNIGMGLSSRGGKLRQHSAVLPVINPDKCRFCKKCIKWCPSSVIVERNQKAFILKEKCIGCGECLASCRFDAVTYDWGIESAALQKNIAEHALGVIKCIGEKCFYLNVLVDMTKDCDCFNIDQHKLIPDVGILASYDPVAIDKATLDLTTSSSGKSLADLSYNHLDPLIHLKHAAKLGLGSLEYELIKI